MDAPYETAEGPPVPRPATAGAAPPLTSLLEHLVRSGVISRTILVAVLLILYGGQNLTIVPMLPMYLGGLPDSFWLIMLITALLIAALMALAIRSFRKSEF